MRGLVLKGSKNIFCVQQIEAGAVSQDSNSIYECRIKGKVLKQELDFYNPLAPGDLVQFELCSNNEKTALITAMEPRRNLFARFNSKGELPQILAANIELVICVTTPSSPPFRPRFIDRVLVQAESASVPACIIVNKCDLSFLHIQERLCDFQRLGYPVLMVSAKTGENIPALRDICAGKLSVFTGQSGVGKSSLINALCPCAELKTGALNQKYDRGRHTTVQAEIMRFKTGDKTLQIIDTPGLRQFIPAGIAPEEVPLFMPEIAPLAGKCAFGISCRHESEKGCAILEAAKCGEIHSDRLESFLRLRNELEKLKTG
jgi:ribosome biogenesis GTPase